MVPKDTRVCELRALEQDCDKTGAVPVLLLVIRAKRLAIRG
jgi:hypothetical protein